jgi:hypothetical protein
MDRFKPIPFKLASGSDAETRFKNYLRDRYKSCKRGLTRLHGMDGIIKWRKAYNAEPAEAVREFPWHNASNLVVPIVAIHSDTLLARLMSAVMKTKPLWIIRELGEWHKQTPEGLRDAGEEFLQYVGLEPGELDLYRVYHEWFHEVITLGTSIVKVPWVQWYEDQMGPSADMTGGVGWNQVVRYEGPRPEKLRYENFFYPVNATTIDAMDFKFDLSQLSKRDIQDRVARKIYDSRAAGFVLAQPDRTGNQPQAQAQKEQDAKVHTQPDEYSYEWDIAEIHCRYWVDPEHYARLIVHYHEKSNQILRSYYHYYPDDIYIAARLFYRSDIFPGMGFGEILLPFQEEISEIHNQRRDNMTIANMKMWAVDPDSKLHKGFRIFPSAMLPARQQNGQKEIEPLEMGTPVQGEIDSERLSLELAEKRSGVSPPMQGSGSGFNTKRGVYTAMGTLSLLQEGNTRTDLNITDIRYAHTRLGRLLCMQYGTFGIPGHLKEMFGEAGEKIQKVMESIAERKMALPVYASSASINREVEKQADMMMVQQMERYHQMITQMAQSISMPTLPPEQRKYIVEAMDAMRTLMKTVARHFSYDEVDRLLPDTPKPQEQAPQPGPGGPAPQGGPPGAPPMLPPTLLPGGRIQ